MLLNNLVPYRYCNSLVSKKFLNQYWPRQMTTDNYGKRTFLYQWQWQLMIVLGTILLRKLLAVLEPVLWLNIHALNWLYIHCTYIELNRCIELNIHTLNRIHALNQIYMYWSAMNWIQALNSIYMHWNTRSLAYTYFLLVAMSKYVDTLFWLHKKLSITLSIIDYSLLFYYRFPTLV